MSRPLSRALLLAASLVAPALPAGAGSVDFAGDFAVLRIELEGRRDGALSGTLDAEGKRQRAAVLKCLAAIERGGDDLGDEIRAARTAGKALPPVYPSEFGAGSLPPPLGTLLAGVLTALQSGVEDAVAALEAAVDGLPVDEASRVAPLAAKARAALPAPDPSDPAGWAGDLLRAWGAAERGTRLVDRLNARRGHLSMTVSLVDYEADSVELRFSQWNWFDLFAGTSASPSQTPPPPRSFALVLQVRGSPSGNGNSNLYYAEVTLSPGGNGIYRARSGTVTVTGVSGRRVSGTFSFIAANALGITRAVSGTFDARR